MRFLLFVGASNTLAEFEVGAQIKDARLIQDNIYIFESDSEVDAQNTVSRLGCSIKLAKELPGVAAQNESIADLITHKNFSITSINDFSISPKINQDVKNLLERG